MTASHTIGQIITDQWTFIQGRFNSFEIRHLNAIRRCRTAALGGELYLCISCGKHHKRYYSCRNRHCPQCQNTQKEQWIAHQEDKLIDTDYYHVVFTIPHNLNEVFLAFKPQMYSLLMRTAWKTLDAFGWNHKYLGAQIGATMTLHTWGSNMSYHPHVHCIVPGGGIDLRGKWRDAKHHGKFLFPVKAMSQVFRGKFIAQLHRFMSYEGMELDSDILNKLYEHDWVVYAKPPFGGSQGVIRYLARYTHKICVTNHRIINYDSDKQMVTISYIDYRHKNQQKQLTLHAQEFIRRYVQHILPKHFSRIRHYGILSSTWKKRLFPNVSTSKKSSTEVWTHKGIDVFKCPHCHQSQLVFVTIIDPVRGPPHSISYHQPSKTPCS